MKLFELFATLGLDTSEFDQSVKSAQGKMGGLGNSIGNGLEKASKVVTGTLAAAGTALVSFSKVAVDNAATVIAENAAFESTFGDMADEAKSAYKVIGDQANILGARLQATGTKGFAQFKGAGLSANEALDASARLLSLAADGAAYYDRELEDVDERLRSFLRGNTEAGDSIGLFTNEMQRNNKALELYGVKWDKLTEAQRQFVMLDIAEQIYEQSEVIGQAARESDGWANTVGNLQKAWQLATAEFGKPIIEAITPAINSITETLQREDVQSALSEFGGIVGEVAAGAIVKFNDALQWAIDNKNDVTESFKAIAAAGGALIAIEHPAFAATAALVTFIAKVGESIEKARVFTEEEAPKMLALAEQSGVPTETAKGIAEGAEGILTVGGTVADQAAQFAEAVVGGLPNGKSQKTAKKISHIIEAGGKAMAVMMAEGYVESEAKKAQEELKKTSPYQAVQIFEETGDINWMPETFLAGAPITQSDLAGIAASEGLSPYETQLLMSGKYSPTVVSGAKSALHPDVRSIAPYIDQELLAKDAKRALEEAEKAYREAGNGAYEMSRGVSAATVQVEEEIKATTKKTQSVEEAEAALSEYVMSIFEFNNASGENLKTTGEILETLEKLSTDLEEAKANEEEAAQATAQMGDAADHAASAVETLESTIEELGTEAENTSGSILKLMPLPETAALKGKIGEMSTLIIGLRSTAISAASAISSIFSTGPKSTTIATHAATGLERVPYDGFPAVLHRDEMVLDRQDANAYRNGNANGQERGGVTVVQNIQAVPQTASELAFQTMNALEMLRFSV